MTTIDTMRTSNSMVLLGAGLALAGMILGTLLMPMILNIPGIGEIPFDATHAVEKHGAQEVADVVSAVTATGPGGHWRCKDGKEYIIAIDGEGMANIVPIMNGEARTAFRCVREYIRRKLEYEGCERVHRFGHDNVNGALPQ